MKKVYWSMIQVADWSMYSAATDRGICYIGTPDAPFEELKQWVEKRIKKAELMEKSIIFRQCETELKDYYEGTRKDFTFPLDLYGTVFQQEVWQALQNIPYGMTCAYIDVAYEIGNPRAVRAVSGAIGANPVLIAIPCHRVLTKDGKLGGFRGGLTTKKKLLAIENSTYKGE